MAVPPHPDEERSAPLLYGFRRLGQERHHLATDFLIAHRGVEIAAQLAEDVLVARLLEIGEYHALGVFLGISAALAELPGGPETQKLVAAGHRLEAQFLVMRELVLEGILAVVECGHDLLVGSGSMRRLRTPPLWNRV